MVEIDEEIALAQARLEQRRAAMRASSSARGDAMMPLAQVLPTSSGLPTAPSRSKLARPASSSSGTNPNLDPSLTITPVGSGEPFTCPEHGLQPATLRASAAFLGRTERWVHVCQPCAMRRVAVEAAEVQAAARAAVERRVQSIGVMEAYRPLAALQVDAQSRAAILAASMVLRNGAGGLYLWGQPGRGKTAVLESVAVSAVLEGRSARFFQLGTLLAQLKASFDDEGADPTRGLAAVDVLVIDNLDGIRLTSWGRSVLSELVVLRYADRARRITAFGCTVCPSEVAEALDIPAVGSRWDDWGRVVEITGRSRRAP